MSPVFISAEPQPGRPLQHHDPFVLILVVPEIFGEGGDVGEAVSMERISNDDLFLHLGEFCR